MTSRATAASVPVKSRAENDLRVKSKPWLRIRYLAVLAVLVWAGFRFWHVEVPQVTQLTQQQHQLQSQLNSLQTLQAKYKLQVAEFQNKSFLEGYVSRHYHYVLPGQELFVVSSKP